MTRIVAKAGELQEGLFGQVILYIAEILPYLAERKILPEWDIRSTIYGSEPDFKLIPGLLDLAYQPGAPTSILHLRKIRARHASRLGNNWHDIHRLWSSYFSVPDRILAEADAMGDLSEVLGVHYRGTDKLAALWDTNPVSHADFLAIVRDFLKRRPDLKRILLASDDNDVLPFLQSHLAIDIIHLGAVESHRIAEDLVSDRRRRGERALLDCVLLSRCSAVVKTSSALSGFAKVLRPDLEIYRCAASKKFTDIPYFPVAYIPKYQSDNPEIRDLLDRLMTGDWLSPNATMEQVETVCRWPKRDFIWSAWERLSGHHMP